MVRSGWKRFAALLVCTGISFAWAYHIRCSEHDAIRMIDFGEVYHGARCVLHHEDPYNPNTVLREFQASGGRFPSQPTLARLALIVVTIGVNLPTALLLLAPFALLPWGVAQLVWSVLIATSMVAAISLICSKGGASSRPLLVLLGCCLLMNSVQVMVVGNIAGIVVSLCAIAVWCFLTDRHTVAGVLLLAISLVLKPHDSGFVWLYFLLAGGVLRRRAIQTLVVAGVLGLFAALWIAPASPHWVQELHRNQVLVSGRGSTSDPGPNGLTSGQVGSINDLQAFLSILRDDPSFYNPASYLIGGCLILLWALTVLRKGFAPEQAWLAIAAISVLTLLPIYHRPYDAKLLMLTFPACAMLWEMRGRLRWYAVAFTLAALLATSDLPQALLLILEESIHVSSSTLSGKAVLALLQPAPLILLATGCFYLWVYMRYAAGRLAPQRTPMVGGGVTFAE